MPYSDEELLIQLRQQASEDGVAPSGAEIDQIEGTSTYTYRQYFGKWWQAVVRAGLTPRERHPLTDEQWKQYHDAALTLQKPSWKLAALFGMFTGLTPTLSTKITESWIDQRKRDTLIQVPKSETESGEKWTFKLPKFWTHNGNKIRTELPDLLSWYVSNRELPLLGSDGYRKVSWRVAVDADLTGRREVHRKTDLDIDQPMPLVRHMDLRATGGVRMARNGAPARRIRRHLGIEHTNWEADVEDFFLWLYVHEGFVHPDYDPPDVVLDPI
jgi:hypothetical protein